MVMLTWYDAIYCLVRVGDVCRLKEEDSESVETRNKDPPWSYSRKVEIFWDKCCRRFRKSVTGNQIYTTSHKNVHDRLRYIQPL